MVGRPLAVVDFSPERFMQALMLHGPPEAGCATDCIIRRQRSSRRFCRRDTRLRGHQRPRTATHGGLVCRQPGRADRDAASRWRLPHVEHGGRQSPRLNKVLAQARPPVGFACACAQTLSLAPTVPAATRTELAWPHLNKPTPPTASAPPANNRYRLRKVWCIFTLASYVTSHRGKRA